VENVTNLKWEETDGLLRRRSDELFGLKNRNFPQMHSVGLLKADEAECCDCDQREKQNDSSHVLDHAGLVILRISARILVSRQIEQLAYIASVIARVALTVAIVTRRELQNLATAIVPSLWFAGHHRIQHHSFILKRPGGSEFPDRNIGSDKST
jgi:hypothetical protein